MTFRKSLPKTLISRCRRHTGGRLALQAFAAGGGAHAWPGHCTASAVTTTPAAAAAMAVALGHCSSLGSSGGLHQDMAAIRPERWDFTPFNRYAAHCSRPVHLAHCL